MLSLNSEFLPTEFNTNVMCSTTVALSIQAVVFQCSHNHFVYPVHCTLPDISHHTYVSRTCSRTSFCFVDVVMCMVFGSDTASSNTYSLNNFVISMPATEVLSLVD